MRPLACLLTCALCAVAQSGGAVSGGVVSSVDDAPVAGALVTLRGMEAPPGARLQTYIVETGADGRFSIADVAPGVYDARASKVAYVPRPPERFATANDFPPVTVESGKAASIELCLIPDGVISGRVLDADGDPLRNANIEALQYRFVRGKKELNTVGSARSDDQGYYRIFNLAPGRYYLRTRVEKQNCGLTPLGPILSGFSSGRPCNGSPVALGPVFYPGVWDASHATELAVSPGAESGGIDLRLGSRVVYQIRGTFSGVTGGVQSTALQIFNADGTAAPLDSEVGDEGYYLINDVSPGAYRITADFSYGQERSEEQFFAVERVEVINHDVDAPLAFHKGHKVTGRIQLEGGPAEHREDAIAVTFVPVGDGIEAEAAVPPDGSVFGAWLAPGAYRVELDRTPPVYLKALRAGDLTLPKSTFDAAALAHPLTIIAGGDLGSIEGQVVDDEGKPVYNADVTILRDGDDEWTKRFRAVFTKSDGRFRSDGLIPGEYKAYAWLGAPPTEPEDPAFRKPYESRAATVKVAARETQSVKLRVIVAGAAK
jgi:Carboxypeptidase regulatory-like domain